MNFLTSDIHKFVVQKGIVKDAIVESVLLGDEFKSFRETILFIKKENIIVCVNKRVGYVCRWYKDRTIFMYRSGDHCDVKLFDEEIIVKNLHLETNEGISVFTMIMDYYEIENILWHNASFSKKIRPFIFS